MHIAKVAAVGVAAIAAAPAVADDAAAPFTAGHPSLSAEHLGPDELPATTMSYRLQVRLAPEQRELGGRAELSWTNPAAEPVAAVPLHLYLNAFRGESSTWLGEARSGSALRFDADDFTRAFDDPWGSIELAQVTQRGLTAAAVDAAAAEVACAVGFIQPDDGNRFDRTLAEVTLAEPVPPGGSLDLDIDFRARLPIPIARTGGFGDYFHVGQWFPKIGVYEPAGVRGASAGRWAARQFHAASEFYADFADFDVTIDVPAGFTVLATGAAVPPDGAADPGYERHRFTQRAVHDFAFIAARGLHVESHAHTPAGGGPEIAVTYATPAYRSGSVARMREVAEASFDVLAERVGPYPYRTMTIVKPPFQALATAGMEYPTLVTDMPGDALLDWLPRPISDETIAHEIAHNYFQGMLASDEQREAHLDEGFARFWEAEIVRAIGADETWNRLLGYPHDPVARSRQGLARAAELGEAVVQMPTSLFYPGTTGAQAYARPHLIWTTASRRFGGDEVDRVLSTYFRRWRFRHPGTDDLLQVADEVGPPELAAFLREALRATGSPDYRVDDAGSERWSPPLGWLETDAGATW